MDDERATGRRKAEEAVDDANDVWSHPQWVSTGEGRHAHFQDYINAVAEARYIIRKIFRIVEGEAKQHQLDPLEHQALIQIYAAAAPAVPTGWVAARLDIAPAFASRLIRGLEKKGLVIREQSREDRRVTFTSTTPAGEQALRAIDAAVHVHVQYFQNQLSDKARSDALATFVFYLGYDGDSGVARALHETVARPAGH